MHGRAKKAIKEITEAEDKVHAEKAIKEFEGEFGSKWPEAVEKITSDQEALLAYYDFPSEHWRHLHTTNPIESPFATVSARTDLTKEPGSRESGVAMIFKALEAAEGKKEGDEILAGGVEGGEGVAGTVGDAVSLLEGVLRAAPTRGAKSAA